MISRILWLLAGLAGTLLVIVALAGAALFLSGAEQQRRLLVHAADLFLDVELDIGGELSLQLGRNLQVTANEIRLAARDGGFTATVGHFHGSQRLGSWLTTGTLWINRLEFDDVQVHVRQPAGDGRPLRAVALPPVIVHEARLHNVHLYYTQLEPAAVHEISLLELELDDVNDSGPVEIAGAGLVNGRPLSLEGRLGPLATLQDPRTPYTLELTLTSGDARLELAGAVADPVRGKGLDLVLALTDPEFSKTLRLFDRQTPEIGSLQLQAQLTGDYAAPGLQDLELHVVRGEGVALHVTGAVDDAATGEGLEAAIDLRSDDPAILSWLLFDAEDRLHGHSLRVSGSVREEDGRFLASGVKAAVRNRRGLDLAFEGDTWIPTRTNPRPPPQPRQLVVRAAAPGLTAFNLPEFGDLPDLGRVTGTSTIQPYLDGARFTQLGLEAGDEADLHATAAGSIDFLPGTLHAGITGIALDITLEAASSTRLGEVLGRKLPDLGAVRVRLRAGGSTGNLVLEDIHLETGPPQQPVIRASGSATTKLREHTTRLQADFDVATGDLLAALRDVTPDYLGRIGGKVALSDIDGSWSLDSFDIRSSQTQLFTLAAAGALEDLARRDRAEINVKLDVPDPAALGRAADIDFRGIGPFGTQGVMTFREERFTYTGRDRVGRTQSTTTLSGTLAGERPSIRGSFVIPALYLEDFGLVFEESEAGDTAGTTGPGRTQAPRRAHLFSREPLDLGWLRVLDLDLEIRIDDIASKQVSADRLRGRVQIEDGRLQVRPMQLVAEGGPTDLDLVLDSRGTPSLAVTLTANDQKLGRWIAQVQDSVPVDGFASYHIVLQAGGRSAHELAAGLEGQFALAFENARVPSRYVTMLSADVFGWVLDKTDQDTRYADLDCILASFEVEKGVATSMLLAADGPNLAVEGRMTLDFGAETIDAVLLPEQKRTVFKSIAPVKLTGDMREPQVDALPAKEAAKNIGTLVLVPYVAIPVAVLGKLWQSVSDRDAHGGGCASLQEAKAAEVERLGLE